MLSYEEYRTMSVLGEMIGGAAKSARIRLNTSDLTEQDYQDVVGSAALGSVKGQKWQPDNQSYEFVCAKNEAMSFILTQIFDNGHTSHLQDYEDYEGEPQFVSPLEVSENQLADLFLKYRSKKGRRGYNASLRDAKICNLILAGYSNDGIGQEMDISAHNVRRYRTDIRARLQKIKDACILKEDVDLRDFGSRNPIFLGRDVENQPPKLLRTKKTGLITGLSCSH